MRVCVCVCVCVCVRMHTCVCACMFGQWRCVFVPLSLCNILLFVQSIKEDVFMPKAQDSVWQMSKIRYW